MNRIRTFLMDDEPAARGFLRRALARDPDLELVGEAGDGAEALTAIPAARPDLIFLDVQMPELDGFAALAALGAAAPPLVVFATAHDRHALRAFEARALDYLLKPFDETRLEACLDRVKAQWRGRRPGPDLASLLRELRRPAFLQCLTVRKGERIHLVRTSEIRWIQADDGYVRVHTAQGEHLLRETLTSLEARLDPAAFLRIHRSFLVSVAHIQSLEPLFHGEFQVNLQGGTRLTLSRRYRKQAEEVLGRL